MYKTLWTQSTALLSMLCVMLCIALIGCESGEGLEGEGGAEAELVTYYQDVKPIIESHCAHCHVEGGAGLFELTSFESARMWGVAIVEATANLRMPPWGAYEAEDCSPSRAWQEDLSLSDEQRATLAQWVADGSIEGDPMSAETGSPFVAQTLERVDFEGRASAPVNIEPGQDSFVCVVIDPEITEETWLKGVEFIPDNKALVHHVVLFTDPTRASLELMDERGVYPCFGSAQVPGSVAAAWAPGIQPNVLPADHATRVAAGTLFVMQMHYSPQGGADELSDQTTLRFQYADEPPRYEAYLQLMGNLDFELHPGFGLMRSEEELDSGSSPEFLIPAGVKGHRERLRWTYTGDLPLGGPDELKELKLHSVSPHMHYAGVDMKVYIDRPEPTQGACEQGMLSGFFTCANGAGCLEDDNTIDCMKSECEEEWDAMTLSCWGCAQRVFTGGGDMGSAIAQIGACERPEEARMSFVPEEPLRECLISAPSYTFEWQRAYRYAVPREELPTFMPGDTLTIDCGYDNSMDNPSMRAALSRAGLDAPRDIVLGDETLDEMCLVGLLFSFERRD